MARDYGHLLMTLLEGDRVNIHNGAVIIEIQKRSGSQTRIKIIADKRLTVRREPRSNWDDGTEKKEND